MRTLWAFDVQLWIRVPGRVFPIVPEPLDLSVRRRTQFRLERFMKAPPFMISGMCRP